VAEEATAFGLRRDHVLIEIIAWFLDGPDNTEEERHRQWARATREVFDAIALPGGYPNLLAGDEDPDRVARSYGRNAERLTKAKRRYDPDNVFRSTIPLPSPLRWPAHRDPSAASAGQVLDRTRAEAGGAAKAAAPAKLRP
jgi:berberine-like enzyme